MGEGGSFFGEYPFVLSESLNFSSAAKALYDTMSGQVNRSNFSQKIDRTASVSLRIS